MAPYWILSRTRKAKTGQQKMFFEFADLTTVVEQPETNQISTKYISHCTRYHSSCEQK